MLEISKADLVRQTADPYYDPAVSIYEPESYNPGYAVETTDQAAPCVQVPIVSDFLSGLMPCDISTMLVIYLPSWKAGSTVTSAPGSRPLPLGLLPPLRSPSWTSQPACIVRTSKSITSLVDCI